MELELLIRPEYLNARNRLVNTRLWRSAATPRFEQMLSYIVPKTVQGMVHMRPLRARPSHVHAVGLGGKNDGDEPAVIVYVTRKLPESELSASEIVPKEVDGVRTDVVESPMARLAACTDLRRRRNRPLVGGVSVGRSGGPSGTLGTFVESTRAGDPVGALYLLSNSHVLFSGKGRIRGVGVVQPAVDDGDGDRVAVLERATSLGVGRLIGADAAIARVDLPGGVDNQICGIGAIAGATAPVKDMVVSKHGRTTGLTTGTIKAVGLAAEVLDEHDRRLRFMNVFRVEPNGAAPVARLGDSGSLVVRETDRVAVGLLYAADEAGRFYLAQPIDDVCKELEIALKLES
jgi:hypothetical protein